MTFFKSRLGWDEYEVKSQLRRTNNQIRLQAIAGSPSDRESAIVERDKSAEVLEKEGPKLLSKIEALQKQHDALERDSRLSAKRVEDQAVAVEQLRKLVPDHIQDKYNADRVAPEKLA